jgi:hypothetical protein
MLGHRVYEEAESRVQVLVESTLAHASRRLALYLVSAALLIAAFVFVSKAAFEILVLLNSPPWLAFLLVGVLDGGIAVATFRSQSRPFSSDR